MKTLVAALALIAVAGCGDQTPTNVTDAGSVADSPDAPTWDGPCWPMDSASPGGSLAVGSGPKGEFQPMPPELVLDFGQLGGYGFFVNVKQTGFAPGDPVDVLAVTNPRTRIRAFFADTNVSLMFPGSACPYRFAYKDIGGGEYIGIDTVPVVFNTCWRSGNLIGKQIRIEAEILDWNGTTYASDSAVVTAAAPAEYPDEPDAPGCPI